MAKRSGRYRLLEVPKATLKAVQRRILHEILDEIPVHPACHGFASGRSIATYAAPHCGQAVVWRVDLKDFFPSVSAARVRATFQTAGYPEAVAHTLTGLCTTLLATRERPPGPASAMDRYRGRHLPQGAPTSPALANLAAYRLDLRLASWARAFGVAYTRYADDMAFSGGTGLDRAGPRFRAVVFQIIAEEGFQTNGAKSRWMTAGQRQHVAGVVVNERPNVARPEFDRLKAILTNCVRLGPAEQNREGVADFRGHLLGRIAHVAMLNPNRGRKLREIWLRIPWGE